MTPQQRAEYFRRLEAQRRAQQRKGGGDQRPKYRKRKRTKPNVGVILLVVILLAVVGVSLWWMWKNPHTLPEETGEWSGESESNVPLETDEPIGETESGEVPVETEAETDAPTPSLSYDSYSVNSADINLGDLILVNYQHAYSLADSVDTMYLYGNKNGNYQLSTTNHRLTERVLNAMNKLADAFFADTGLTEILVVSSYRTTADQQSVYDSKVQTNGAEYAANYVAQPGYSEHHTGMAVDLSFYRASDGATIPVADHAQGSWLTTHGPEYGFILRYPENKVDITKIAYEPWHFRFVGKPHAAVMTKAGLCLEEYIGLLKDYTLEGKLLHALSDGTTAEVTAATLPTEGYVIYYVPASAGESTELRIPAGYANYSVSGNNVDGFIVTVYVGQ